MAYPPLTILLSSLYYAFCREELGERLFLDEIWALRVGNER